MEDLLMANEKIVLESELKERIKRFTKEKGYSESQIANRLGITKSKYKNIVRETKGNKTIDSDTLQNMARCYECSYDYLLGESDERMKDRKGNPVKFPVDFFKREAILDDLRGFINKGANYDFLWALHYILFIMDPDFQKNFKESIIELHKVMQKYSFLNRRDTLTEDTYNKIIDILKLNDEIATKGLVKLVKADALLSVEYYYDAFKLYAELILEDQPHIGIVDSATKNLKNLIVAFPELDKLDLTDKQRELIESLSSRHSSK